MIDLTKLLVIDSGHGGGDSGAVGNGLLEKDLTLAMAKRVKVIIETEYTGVTVKMTRDSDKFLPLSERADIANKAKADYFISFHVNAGGGTGYEDFIYNKQTKGSATDKARQTIHAEVAKVLTKHGIKNRGMKFANHAVTRETNMKAVLVETLFIDNKDDAAMLKKAAIIEDFAQAYAKGLVNVLGGKAKAKPKTTTKLYRVQVGAFGAKSNAENLAKELNKLGYATTIKYE